ncbi:MAG TPA: hypothetical protein GXZ90_00365 [Clostridiales bacterium]|nr:hypothetical protein [Clostridiales bacterium]
MNESKVITLCGSTKFKREFEEINTLLTIGGHVVISVGVFSHSDNLQLTKEQKEKLDKIHRQKINMSDEIFVINVGGYIGNSTKNEIDYAIKSGKKVNLV